jgi:2-polyprenyl-3-methyl-5-hydroxy-6-metoxy-1,4-benzoquinol methylase
MKPARDYDPALSEMMDRPQPVTPLLEQDLRNLEMMNRLFGGHAILKKIVEPWMRSDSRIEILDLATGAGDNPRFLASLAATRGCEARITAVDANPSTIAIAKKFAAENAPGAIEFVVDDIFKYEPGRQFDIVLCTLALHHFTRDQAVLLLARMRELSRGHVVVTDLCRSRLGTFGVWLLTHLWMRNPMTRHDGMLSMRRAWNLDEMRELADEAGWPARSHALFPVARQAIWF